jgi:regulatory protein
MSSAAYKVAKLKLEHFCAYQERCSYEVHKKLEQFDLSEQEVEQLISELKENKYLDDERFARSYASGKFRLKGWGKIKIKSHLRSKFINNDLLNVAFEGIEQNEYVEKLQSLASKKWEELKSEQDVWKRKQKLFRYLSSKGYESFLFEDLAL